MKCKYISAILFSIISIVCSAQETADLVFTNAYVYTVDPGRPYAQAVAVKNGRILDVGTNEWIKKFTGGETRVIDCRGKFLMPGFIEGHGHIHNLGSFLLNLNLNNTRSWEEVVALVDSAVKKAKPGEWIIGRGWHQEKWISAPAKNHLGYPYHHELSRVSPNNPVMLTHASGHAAFANAKAMELAGIKNTSRDPEGGTILRDARGEILGVMQETAEQLIEKPYINYLKQMSEDERMALWAKGIALAEDECIRKGITSFQDAASTWEQVGWMRRLNQSSRLKLRYWLMVWESPHSMKTNAGLFSPKNDPNEFLTVRAIKLSLDGALGSYGAWLIEPYSDRRDWKGQPTMSIDSLNAVADFAWQHDIQLCVHAIGDQANRELVNTYAERIKTNRNKDHRWRVEHAQHVNPVEIPRFSEYNIIASMQGVHCTSDAPFVPKRLGDKRSEEGAYVWQKFLNAGVLVTNGTDVPVEDVDPIACFYSSVTRRLKDGTEFYPDQRMTREQAIYSYTMANAIASFQENLKGSITKGKLADLVLLSENLLTCGDEEILGTRVVMTVVGGKVYGDF